MTEPTRVVGEVAVVGFDAAGAHPHELIAHAAEQPAVMRHQHHGACELLQRDQQRITHLMIEVVGGFVEQQQVRTAGHEDGERQPRAFAAGEPAHRLEHAIAAEAERAEMVALLLLGPAARRSATACELAERSVARVELVDLELCEEPDFEVGRSGACTTERL